MNATHYIGRENNLQRGTQTEYGLRTSVCGKREGANTKNWCRHPTFNPIAKILFATLKCKCSVHPPTQDRLGTVKEIHSYPGCPGERVTQSTSQVKCRTRETELNRSKKEIYLSCIAAVSPEVSHSLRRANFLKAGSKKIVTVWNSGAAQDKVGDPPPRGNSKHNLNP